MARGYHHGDLRAALMRATVKLAEKEGPDGVTLRGVARMARVSEAAPYHHFQDRRELLVAAAAEGFRALAAHVADALGGLAAGDDDGDAAGDDDALVAVARAYTSFAMANRGSMRLMLGAHVVDDDLQSSVELKEAASHVRAALSDAVARALPHADARARKRFEQMAWAQVHGVVSLVVEKELSPPPTPEQATALAADAVRLLARGARC